MTEDKYRGLTLSDEQKQAVDSGTHVIDPVHGLVPKRPVGAGDVVPEAISTPDNEQNVLQAQAEAVKATEKTDKTK